MKPELLNFWSGNLIFPELRVLVLTERHAGTGNEIEINVAIIETDTNLKL